MSNRILLVDDEETLRCVLKETLNNEGYNVDVANDGFQALERFKLIPYDLLITDIKMHGMDGLQLIREIKKNNSHAKIIIITAYGSLETVKEAMRLGVVEFISKPFKLQEIRDGITRTLCDFSLETENDLSQSKIGDSEQLSITDTLLAPTGLSHYFVCPSSQPKNTAVFDFVAINSNKAMIMFGNINGQIERHREWWENRQIEIMIKTLFRSNAKSTPKRMVENINNFLYKNIYPHVEVSILCALVDKRKRVIRYIKCGNNLVCSVFAPNGQIEIMESFPSLLGIYPKIEICERYISCSYESRLILASSSATSKIIEKGTLLRLTVENILQSIKSSQRKQSKEIDLQSLFTNKKEINFDDETLLLMNLDWNYTPCSMQS